MRTQFGIAFMAALLAISVPSVNADDPPDAATVASTVTNLWQTEQFQELGTYITNLYHSFSNYVPSQLAMSFYQYVYQGNITNAIAHIEQIRQDTTNNPANYSTNFVITLDQLSYELNEDKDMFLRWGSLSQITPSVSVTKAAWTDDLPMSIEILLNAPSIDTGD